MKIQDIKDLSIDELTAQRKELRATAFNLRLQQKLGQLEKPSQIRLVRRDIARIETVLTRRKAQAAEA
ncbi:MAG TPA: 50S ribosomal protein L29 [Chthoniobacteraceae bacterium]|nr:50S ribosomal protein L29 [Chthoniobacteraceae bacterium]